MGLGAVCEHRAVAQVHRGEDHGPIGDVERCEWAGHAVTDIVVGAPLGIPGIIGSTGLLRARA